LAWFAGVERSTSDSRNQVGEKATPLSLIARTPTGLMRFRYKDINKTVSKLQLISSICKHPAEMQFKRRVVLCLAFLLFPALLSANDANSTSVEYKIKAGYLYNFTKFITWPEENVQTFNLCILGNDPFGDLINPIEKRSVQGRPIKLFRFNHSPKRDQRCHILYINAPGSNTAALKNDLALLDSADTLTVGEGGEFAKQGGMVGFVSREDKIKIQINLKAFKQSGLTVSAKLLEVAEIIGGTP